MLENITNNIKMAYKYNEQTYSSNFLIPFTIANDCPQENRELSTE